MAARPSFTSSRYVRRLPATIRPTTRSGKPPPTCEASQTEQPARWKGVRDLAVVGIATRRASRGVRPPVRRYLTKFDAVVRDAMAREFGVDPKVLWDVLDGKQGPPRFVKGLLSSVEPRLSEEELSEPHDDGLPSRKKDGTLHTMHTSDIAEPRAGRLSKLLSAPTQAGGARSSRRHRAPKRRSLSAVRWRPFAASASPPRPSTIGPCRARSPSAGWKSTRSRSRPGRASPAEHAPPSMSIHA